MKTIEEKETSGNTKKIYIPAIIFSSVFFLIILLLVWGWFADKKRN